ncbi:MAG: hypothetical protein P8K80_08235 [Phycisphaerales bacterium]|nr:hypothetical protein [Phycisphaerales bacterium]
MEDPGHLRRLLLKGKDESPRTWTPWQLTMAGVVGAVVLLGIVLLLDSSRPNQADELVAETEVVDLVGPRRLNEHETASGGMLDPDIGLDLPAGGWVQIADGDGNLAQQYRCEHLDPNPPEYPAHWIDMVKPQVELYLSNNRLVTITGDRAVAYAPSRALETGRITGNVRINLYEPVDGAIAQPSLHPPDMEMRTSRAEFDNFLGKILCDDRIDLTTSTETMVGHDLQILLNSQADRIEFLTLAHLDYLLMQPEQDAVSLKIDPEWPPRTTVPRPRLTTGSNRAIRPVHAQVQPATPDTSDTVFYTMTLHENIRILQGDIRDGKVVTGDDLHITFSMESNSLSNQARDPNLDPVPMARAMSWPQWLTWMTIANSSAPVPGPDDILLTCDGGVSMIPLEDTDARPASPEETQAELVGNPVYILDSAKLTEITCRRVFYHSLADRFDLVADEGGEVLVKDNRLRARGTHLWISPENGQGGFIDAGVVSMLSDEPSPSQATTAPLQATTTAAVLTTANEPLAIREETPEAESPQTELDITWTGGVDLSFEPTENSDQPLLKQIIFNGDVDVQSVDGVISCQQLKMQFDKNEQGKAVPSRMTAVQQVMARNDDQTIWADDLDVTFAQAPEDEQKPADTSTDSESLIGSNTRVQDVFAKGDVQVLLADGARAFADNLQADAAQETVELTGKDVVIARDDMLIDHGREVTLRRKDGTAHWEGPGQARLLTRPLELQSETRIERPQVPSRRKGDPPTVTMRARWNESMDYDSEFNDGAGEIKLSGGVSVIAQPTPEERNQLDGRTLILQFAHAPDERGAPASRTKSPSPFDASGSTSRVLENLIARGDAKLEQRAWQTPDREGEPRIFYISAKHLTWNDIKEEAEVIGNGELVIRDPFTGEEPDPDQERGLFKGPGTSRFVWTRRLDMERDADGGFDMSMEGKVEGIYRGATEEDVASITADRIEARTSPTADPRKEQQRNPNESVLDLGDDMDIDRLLAHGQVYIATPRRRVDCNHFDYNVGTGLAKVSAMEGRTVSILTEGSPTPVRAGSVLWNMDPAIDTITITGARGGAINP